jgi:hypothetical protein
MKKNELIKLIRGAVRAELNESLPKMLSELIKTETTSNVTGDSIGITEQISEVAPTKNIPTKRYSNNEALNKVLNETVGGIPSESPRVGNQQTMTDLNGNDVDINALPDHVSSALTRNYSDVVKLVDQKRGKLK